MARGPIPDFPRGRPTIPEVRDRFAAYYRDHPTWGSLHVVMDDGNWQSIDFCRWWAREQIPVDEEALALCDILDQMTTTQRRKLAASIPSTCRE